MLPAEPRALAGRTRTRSSSGGREAPVLDPSIQPIFDKLRAHRAEVAKQRGVPAYVVALDRTLVEMAQVRPRTTDQLLMLHGMGPARAEQYGEGFLRALAD
jgi:ATP-dependent DNA helicase RecQ